MPITDLPRLMVAAASSGSGKTTVVCTLLELLRRRSCQAAAFKSGPDYIDPMFHRRVLDTPSYNLDLFLLGRNEPGRETACRILGRHGRQKEIAILEGAMERIYGTKEDVPLEQEIGKRLRFMGITLIQVFFYSPGGRKRQVYVTMHTKRKICVPVKKVAAVLSELTDCEMMPARDSRTFVSQEKVTVLFVEATAYQVLYGIKKVTKPGEAVSWDNFSVFWLPEGRFVAGLSDGMGSGLQACGQSETVLDLMEQFLEAGFSRETAVRMINSSIVLQPEPHIFSTVDLASIDLYTGICEFMKIGSAASFIRRERNVECIRGTGLPAGISSELPLDPYRVRIYDGNLLFLMTDGVLGALPEGQEEAVMKDLIWNLPPGTPSEMAARLMEQVQTYGKAADDMTILVVGIWKR